MSILGLYLKVVEDESAFGGIGNPKPCDSFPLVDVLDWAS